MSGNKSKENNLRESKDKEINLEIQIESNKNDLKKSIKNTEEDNNIRPKINPIRKTHNTCVLLY